MGTYVERLWQPGENRLLPSKDRRVASYLAYVPDELDPHLELFGPQTESIAASALQAIIRADERLGATSKFLNYLLIRSESISSSWIEGNRISAKKLAIAELLSSGSAVARDVISNVRATEQALDSLSKVDHEIDLDDILDLHHTVEPRIARGLREVQNFVGGTGWSPLRADFVPPPEHEVARLITNLLAFINETSGNAIVRAALAHAQFETIHPFEDGNGRTGRALIHAVLRRSGVVANSILPISTVFASKSNSYIEALTAFRRDKKGVEDWVVAFCEAAIIAAESSLQFADDIEELNQKSYNHLVEYRKRQGKVPQEPRRDAVILKVLNSLQQVPVTTIEQVSVTFGCSLEAARTALGELVEANILKRNNDQKGRLQCFTADGYLALIQNNETNLKS